MSSINRKKANDKLSGAIEVGWYVGLQNDLTGVVEPDSESYIKLTAELTGTGQYNEGKLTNEQTTGTPPLQEVTAEISDPDSPLQGQTIHLVNSENRYLQPGESPGSVANDVMQQITGDIKFRAGVISSNGVFTNLPEDTPRTGPGGGESTDNLGFDSANSPDARTSDHTAPKHIQHTQYLRHK